MEEKSMSKTQIVTALGVGLMALGGLTACNNHASNNTSVVQPAGPADVIQFPYGFRNVAHKCDGPNMVYSGSAGASDNLPPSIAVIPNDPRCKS
jgi:hypothetical protein